MEPCMAATHKACIALWSISPSVWWATVWPAWEAILGQLRDELDHGPKSKVEAHELLYNIYLGAMVIGVVD